MRPALPWAFWIGSTMKVFMIGGTGLLGSEGARQLIVRGHEVASVALPPLPEGAPIPKEMELTFGNYLEMTDDELRACLTGCDAFVFAAGVDERVEGPAPIYDLYKKYNIDPVRRLLTLCRECGVRHAVICGSYFSHFAKERPELDLCAVHPYIRSRIDQENVAMELAGPDLDVAMLELPYIFGTQPGRKPVWVFLVETIMGMKGVTLYPAGGSAMVTVRQVGEAIAGAVENNVGGNCCPIGWFNLTWKEMLAIMHKHLGVPGKKVITIPKWMYAMGSKQTMADFKKRGVDSGLEMVKFADLMCSNLFIDKSLGCEKLGVTDDDIDAAIGDSIRLSRDVALGRTRVLGMKGE